MYSRLPGAVIACAALLFASVAPIAAQEKHPPSTPEERKQALDFIQDFQSDPLGPRSLMEREWVLKWVIEIPDVHVSLCVLFEKLPKGDKKDSGSILAAMMMAQTAFVLQNPDKQADLIAQYQAGVEGALKVYEILLKANPKDRQPYLDDLIQRRDAGTLADWVKQRAAAACKNS